MGPLSQWLVIVWPMHPDVAQWRYGSVGLLEERLTLPVVGLFTAITAATLLEHRAVQSILGGLSLLIAPVLAVLAISIALDGLQLRHTVRAEQLRGFEESLARTVLVLLYSAIVSAALGWAARKVRRPQEPSRREPTPVAVSERFARGPET